MLPNSHHLLSLSYGLLQDGAIDIANRLRGVVGLPAVAPSHPTHQPVPNPTGPSGDIEMGELNENAFFKRHKVKVSPNLLADEEVVEELKLAGILPSSRSFALENTEVLNPLTTVSTHHQPSSEISITDPNVQRANL